MRAEVLGSVAELVVRVSPEMVAILDGCVVHPVYSTFWLAYHAEVAARRAIEPFFEPGENAVGAELHLRHEAMAPVGADVRIRAEVTELQGNRVWCTVEAFVGTRRIATGRQLQVVLPHEVIQQRVQQAYVEAQLLAPEHHPNVRISTPEATCG
ncbi:MAG: hypothetical protein NZ960_06225 [Candidatus Kapabacteria bacterium]|nr:hypothetical protein [Candidatus Kapabacteria bacterium]MDW8012572.1 hypothetical protein [Bacteroidota bacterium]